MPTWYGRGDGRRRRVYGDTETRQLFADAGGRLVAKVASRQGGTYFPKEDFRIDLETMSSTCPAGQETRKVVSISSGDRYGAPGLPLCWRFASMPPSATGMPVATQVCAGASRQRSPGDVAPSRGGTSGGEGLPEQQLLCSLAQTTAGRRTSAGAVDATRRAPGSRYVGR